jgi:hypothetical protein
MQTATRNPESFMFDAIVETMPRAAIASLQTDHLKHVLQHA